MTLAELAKTDFAFFPLPSLRQLVDADLAGKDSGWCGFCGFMVEDGVEPMSHGGICPNCGHARIRGVKHWILEH